MKIIAKRETLTKKKTKTEKGKRDRNSKKKQQTNKQRQKRETGTEAIMKGFELNDFAVYLSSVFSSYYVKLL